MSQLYSPEDWVGLQQCQSPYFQQQIGSDDTCKNFEPSNARIHFSQAGSTTFLLLNAKTLNEKEQWLTEIISSYSNAIKAGLPAEDEVEAKFGIATACTQVVTRRFAVKDDLSELDSSLAQEILKNLNEAGTAEKKYHVTYIAKNWYQLAYVDLFLDLKASVIRQNESTSAAERFVTHQLAAVDHINPTPLPRLLLTMGRYLLSTTKVDAALKCFENVRSSITRAEARFIPNASDIQQEVNALIRQASGVSSTGTPNTAGKTLQKGGPSQSKSGCFIATAAFGSALAPEVVFLREFRDRVLSRSCLGRWFIRTYYRMSPPLASLISKERFLRAAVRLLVLSPAVCLLRVRFAASWRASRQSQRQVVSRLREEE